MKDLHQVIKTKNYSKSFSVIVTLERFGQIQTDLSELLNIFQNDELPLSICIDDLEIFLLQLKKMGKQKSDFLEFLTLRQKLHGKLVTGDELEICGAFLEDKKVVRKVSNGISSFTLNSIITKVFDTTYHTKGLGFDKEKNLEIKTSGKYRPIGGF